MVSFLLNAAMVTTIFVGGTFLTVRVLDYFTDGI
jgi:hypothetical protein